ncbi:MAG: DUF2075 domain-containing protein, partial [Dehalococcoidales bacterium]
QSGLSAIQKHCGWSGLIHDFLEIALDDLIHQLTEHHQRCMLEQPAKSQIRDWESSAEILKNCFYTLTEDNPAIDKAGIVFEYELPRERGRRPDVILLTQSEAIVIEFKETRYRSQAYVDQVTAYVRDLLHYHSASHALNFTPILVLTQATQLQSTTDDTEVISGDLLLKLLENTLPPDLEPPDLNSWIKAEYDPLPTIVSASRMLFQHEPLPNIRRVHSAGIPRTLETLVNIAKQAENNEEQHLAILTGVPGSGKTLAGLQLVYSDRVATADVRNNAVFLSGNGPLVEVFRHALKNKVFVQDVHGFLMQYGGYSSQIPTEHIWIYDEAQRAWDANRSKEKRGKRISQPEDFLRIAVRNEDWRFIVGLVGEGQEIHVGEEGGMTQWNDAIRKTGGKWVVHCPPKLKERFSSASNVILHNELDLTVSLRSHLAEDVQDWVSHLLDGDLKTTKALAQRLNDQGFDIYITQDLEQAKDYVRKRYLDQVDKKYGLIASSKAQDLEYYGIHNDYYSTRKVQIGPWYNNDPPDHRSCCALEQVVTEFGCQGLELDFPVVCWGSDMMWGGDKWRTPTIKRQKALNPHVFRLNSYRVLLTRGRDGFIVFVPDAPRYEPTVAVLQLAGLKELDKA